ncbi:hypothetical protein ACKF11_13200 [Methylobacillus sp. Pita2]|uniref:hypothetical protein n=1 Tax=Methylobacillus sp. Pita2 TaxID=3383245 RepID=UPI0038B544BB
MMLQAAKDRLRLVAYQSWMSLQDDWHNSYLIVAAAHAGNKILLEAARRQGSLLRQTQFFSETTEGHRVQNITLLMLAGKNLRMDMVEYLGQAGFDFNARDTDGNTVAHYAAQELHNKFSGLNFDAPKIISWMRYLQERGIDLSSPNKLGVGPMTILEKDMELEDYAEVIAEISNHNHDLSERDKTPFRRL